MNFKRITIIALAILLFFSTSSFAGLLRDATIIQIMQDEFGIHITYDSNLGWIKTKTVNAPGFEKNILAIALTAQASGMDVDIEVIDDYIVALRIVSP
jgi:hypothetical protein